MDAQERRRRKEAGGFESAITGSANRLARYRGKKLDNRSFINPVERRIAALQMYHDRMAGATYRELVTKWQLSKSTVIKMLKEVMSDDLVKQLEKRILESVVPMAIEVYTKKLQEGSEFVAKDVLANFAKIADRDIKREEMKQKHQEDEDSLEFLLQIKGKRNFQPALEEVVSVESTPVAVIEAAVSETVADTIRRDVQAVGIEQENEASLSQGRHKGNLPAEIRKHNGGQFTSIRDILRGELK